jgi:hypothetical protein
MWVHKMIGGVEQLRKIHREGDHEDAATDEDTDTGTEAYADMSMNMVMGTETDIEMDTDIEIFYSMDNF